MNDVWSKWGVGAVSANSSKLPSLLAFVLMFHWVVEGYPQSRDDIDMTPWL